MDKGQGMGPEQSAECSRDDHAECDDYTATADLCECRCHTGIVR